MKSFLTIICLALVLSVYPSKGAVEVMSGGEAGEAAAGELSQWLEKSGGESGVVLGVADEGEWPGVVKPWLEKLNKEVKREAYVIVPDKASGRVYIVGRTAKALMPAVYGYLYDLGFRWYFPGERWTHVPRSPDLFAVTPGVVAPAFTRRTFFGSGGFGPKLPGDPEAVVAGNWRDWLACNRFGGDVVPTGHAGDHIISRHREVFVQHPEFRAEVNGERVPADKQFQFSYGNPGLQKWYVENRLSELAAALEKNPEVMGISTDPADGGSPHCESPESLALGTVSDRVFTLTNLTAKAVAERFPGKMVGINAYNKHAAVPNIPLEPNIYVQVIPYAFQRTGMTAEEMLAAWGKKKSSNLGVYDYWNITDWAHCEPRLDYDRTIPQKIRFWRDNHLDGVGIESTYSAGSMGLQAYVASRLLWNPDEDVKALTDEFFEQMFGPAQKPIRRMLDRWAAEYRLTPQEIGLSYRDLDEAQKLAEGNAAIEARIEDYIGYVYYLQHMLEFAEAQGKDARKETALQLIDALWKTHPSGMAQSYRMHRLVNMRMAGKELGEELHAEWSPKDTETPGWQNWKPWEQGALKQVLAEGLKKYPVLYQPAYFDISELKPMTGNPAGETETAWVEAGLRFGASTMAVFRGEAGDPGMELKVADKGNLKVRVEVARAEKPTEVISRLEIGAGDWTGIPLPETPGVYQIKLQPMGTLPYLVRAHASACLTALNMVECRSPKETLTFYVPPGQKVIAFHAPNVGKGQMEFFDGDGEKVESNPGVLKVIPVPEGQDGKVWALKGYAGNRSQQLTFLNGPRVYGFSRDGMLVPKTVRELDRPGGAEKTAEPEEGEED